MQFFILNSAVPLFDRLHSSNDGDDEYGDDDDDVGVDVDEMTATVEQTLDTTRQLIWKLERLHNDAVSSVRLSYQSKAINRYFSYRSLILEIKVKTNTFYTANNYGVDRRAGLTNVGSYRLIMKMCVN